MITAVIIFALLYIFSQVLYVVLQTLTRLLKWMLQNELVYQAEQRPVVLAVVGFLAAASIVFVAYKNGIRSVTDLVRAVSAVVIRVYRYVLEFVVQFIADVIAGVVEYLVEFMFGILVGIVQVWRDFELPKIRVPELDIN